MACKDGGALQGTVSVFQQLADETRLDMGLPVYRKVRLLGRGAFGKAYLVESIKGAFGGSRSSPERRTTTVRRVLKKLPLRANTDEQREVGFNEAQLMRRICRGCPFITQFHEVFLSKAGSMLCLVMEYCSGGDLRSLLGGLEGTRILEEQLLSWSSQIALALQHCHARGVLHRDVKPDNCFFRASGGDLLLGDFGIACALDERSFAKTCVGSPLYLSPEVVNQEPYSYLTDAWSLGVMMYEMAMSRPPFKGSNICQVAFKIMSAMPDPIDAHSEATRCLINSLLEKECSTRASVDQSLHSAALAPWAEHECKKHVLPWPPPSADNLASLGRHGVVQRLRACTTSTCASEEYYEDDFEPPDPEDEEVYDDDFERASCCSSASYEQDFEEDDSAEEADTFNEEVVKQEFLGELGPEGLAAAESLGVVAFLGGIRCPARNLTVVC